MVLVFFPREKVFAKFGEIAQKLKIVQNDFPNETIGKCIDESINDILVAAELVPAKMSSGEHPPRQETGLLYFCPDLLLKLLLLTELLFTRLLFVAVLLFILMTQHPVIFAILFVILIWWRLV